MTMNLDDSHDPLSIFLEDRKLPHLPPKDASCLWVFWSQAQEEECPAQILPSSSSCIPDLAHGNRTNHWAIKDKIKTALCNLQLHEAGNFLVQFWAPITIGSRCFLKTSGQPFGISSGNRGLCSYRLHCESYEFNVEEGESEEDHIGRVFRHKLPELTPDVRCYSTKEFPLRDPAVNCGIKGIVALPVFDPSRRCCVGVLEFVTEVPYLGSCALGRVCRVLKAVDLESSNTRHDLEVEIANQTGLKCALEEIGKVLKVVCQTHQIDIALTWIPCKQSNVMACGGNLEKSYTEEVLATVSEACYYRILSSSAYVLCNGYSLRKGQGLVGKTLLLHKPCVCRDVTQISTTKYPAAHFARKLDLTSSFAICLRSNYTGNRDYVLEFFLHPGNTDSGYSQSRLGSLLAMMKLHFRSFKVASGEELGEELYVEVIKFGMKDELESFKICGTTRSPSRPEAFQNEGEVVQLGSSDQQLIAKDAIGNGRNLVVGEQSDIADCLEKTLIVLDKERKETENSTSYEVLKQHFGRKHEDVAESFDVCRSTFKGGKHEITSWSSRKRNEVTSNLKDVNEFVQGGEKKIPESSSRDALCFDLPPPKQATVNVAYSTPHVTTMEDLSVVTIEATYGEDTVRFELSFSSGMADLKEKLTKRLPLLNSVPFSIKYLDEDGDLILVACDEDLQECIGSSRSCGTTIKMLVRPSTIQSLGI